MPEAELRMEGPPDVSEGALFFRRLECWFYTVTSWPTLVGPVTSLIGYTRAVGSLETTIGPCNLCS